MDLHTFNNAPVESARLELTRCCGSAAWVERMLAQRPFADQAALFSSAGTIWENLERSDWLEAFAHHPKIGDVDSLRARYAPVASHLASTAEWAAGEQKGVEDAPDAVLYALANGNESYEEKFGYIFIVCATGKSAAEMLTILEGRLENNAADELQIAMREQEKITKLRLEKLLA
ncbi:MAG: 2-oxo-4-hydroxy-4-carboxy-5-ureidoimidazoline decarboxylase [Cyanobacteria bacterium REEB67]|nr:2-oxo-4-hydroxy-4-carboxy-5-ureidoimidazoline decarboxylase [Cyanobacteria bacterium REEB67]